MMETHLSVNKYLVIYAEGRHGDFTAWTDRPLDKEEINALLETGFLPRLLMDDHIVIHNRSGKEFSAPITKWRYGDPLPYTLAPLETYEGIVWLDGIPLGRQKNGELHTDD